MVSVPSTAAGGGVGDGLGVGPLLVGSVVGELVGATLGVAVATPVGAGVEVPVGLGVGEAPGPWQASVRTSTAMVPPSLRVRDILW